MPHPNWKKKEDARKKKTLGDIITGKRRLASLALFHYNVRAPRENTLTQPIVRMQVAQVGSGHADHNKTGREGQMALLTVLNYSIPVGKF